MASSKINKKLALVPKEILRDPKLRALVKRHGVPSAGWRRESRGGAFEALTRSIIHQQVSGAAAHSIDRRFAALFGKKKPTPKNVLTLSDETLRSAGLSARKVEYIKDLARHFAEKKVSPKRFAGMTNDELVAVLTKIRGIGVWSVHMFLIFTLGRPDVLPTLDLGIRKGFQAVYDLRHLPLDKEMEKLATSWRKHASTASWYLWRAADELKLAPKAAKKKTKKTTKR